jgi:carbamate kinase
MRDGNCMACLRRFCVKLGVAMLTRGWMKSKILGGLITLSVAAIAKTMAESHFSAGSWNPAIIAVAFLVGTWALIELINNERRRAHDATDTDHLRQVLGTHVAILMSATSDYKSHIETAVAAVAGGFGLHVEKELHEALRDRSLDTPEACKCAAAFINARAARLPFDYRKSPPTQ